MVIIIKTLQTNKPSKYRYAPNVRHWIIYAYNISCCAATLKKKTIRPFRGPLTILLSLPSFAVIQLIFDWVTTCVYMYVCVCVRVCVYVFLSVSLIKTLWVAVYGYTIWTIQYLLVLYSVSQKTFIFPQFSTMRT